MSEAATETEVQARELRFKRVFVVGAVLFAVLGLLLLFTGEPVIGVILLAAALIIGLFTKRRSRLAGGG